MVEVLHQNWHMQGFTTDKENGYMYFSFTDSVVKVNMNSTMIAQVHVSGGHLGDIDYHEGKLYASFLGQPGAGKVWDDWSSFKIYVFNADDLALEKIIPLPICDELKALRGTPEDIYGFNAIDGMTFGPDADGNMKMFAACATIEGEKFSNQILLQLSLDGEFEKLCLIPTGNTVFGIQNLDHDDETGEFWFSTYCPNQPYMPRETLYCVAPDLKTVTKKFCFASPFGFECLGGGKFRLSIQGGKNGTRTGYAYDADESLFTKGYTEAELTAYAKGELQ